MPTGAWGWPYAWLVRGAGGPGPAGWQIVGWPDWSKGPTANLYMHRTGHLAGPRCPTMSALSPGEPSRSRGAGPMVLTVEAKVLYVSDRLPHPEGHQHRSPLERHRIRIEDRCGRDSGPAMRCSAPPRSSRWRRWALNQEPAPSHLSRLAAEVAEVREQPIGPGKRAGCSS